MTFIKGTVTFADGAVTSVGGAVTFVGGAVTFINRAITFIDKESSAIERPFKTAKAGIAGNIKINGYNLRQQLIIYKLKGPSLLINSLISISNYFVQLSS